jgi:putative membrane-bound dehydrogenase-like protein
MLSQIFLAASLLAVDIVPPTVLDDRLQLQLVAAEPDVVTPTGLAVDDKGRVLVIESHTHFRPEGYQGPPADRILMLDDFDSATGKARKISVFFEGTRHTMNLAVYHDGSIYVATRAEVFRLRDRNDDGKADERKRICHLETAGNYPHNGLSGFAFDFAGNVYFGFGENLGADYKLIGSDGTSLAGGGEGGNIYCCDPEGKNLRRIATGFWNPFHLCFDAFGRLFAVDNDPDSRPPCRLLHIVEGGDYGYRFRNGRKGVHPFTAWNGELPGTLPMVAGTGEAPSGVLAYESDNLPEEYRGDLLVTSWGDHRLERYRLKPRGASFSAEMTPVLRGDQYFRPVGIGLAPDGSLYFSDWVDKSYNLHSKGRVWRLSARKPPKRIEPIDDWQALRSADRRIREAAVRSLRKWEPDRDRLSGLLFESSSEQTQFAAAMLLAHSEDYFSQALIVGLLGSHPSANVRAGLARHFVTSLQPPEWSAPGYSQTTGRIRSEPQWPAEAIALLLMNRETRPFALAQIPLDARRLAGSRRQRVATSELQDNNFWTAVRDDPFLLHAASTAAQDEMVRSKRQVHRTVDEFAALDSPIAEKRLATALAARRCGLVAPRELVAELLADPDPRLRIVALLWVAETLPVEIKLIETRVENALRRTQVSKQLFEITLATLEALHGTRRDPKNEPKGEDFAIKVLLGEQADPELRRLALRSLPAEYAATSIELLSKLLADAEPAIRLEAIRTIRQRADAQRWTQLREIAASSERSAQERCEAILGLSPGNKDDRKLLFDLTSSETFDVADEALRALRGFDLSEDEKRRLTELAGKLAGPRRELVERVLSRNPPKNQPSPDDLFRWVKLTDGEGNPQAGERIFFHLRVGGCFRCHEFEGRGYQIGPDLTNIGRTMTRERLVQSIVDPSREIAPMFTNYSILTKDGEVKTGIHVGDEVDGRIKFADQNGRVFHVYPNDIDRRQPSSQSVMPTGLADNLTAQELRDLLAFLAGQPVRLSEPK